METPFRPTLAGWALAATVVLQGLNLLWIRDPSLRGLLSDILQATAALITAILALLAVRTLRRRGHPAARAWLFIAAAMVAWALGMLVFFYLGQVLHERPYPGASEPFFFAFYPLLAAGLWLLPREHLTRLQLWNSVLDIGAVAVVSGLATWQFNLRFQFELIRQAGHVTPGNIVSLVYAGLDYVLLLFALTRLVGALGKSGKFNQVLLLVLGCFCLVPADLLQGYVAAQTDFSSGSPIDLGWVCFSCLAGCAALVALRPVAVDDSSPAETRIQRSRRAWTIVVTYVTIGGILLTLAWSVHHHDSVSPAVLLLSVVVTLAFGVIRQILALRESSELEENLQAARHHLEHQVRVRTEELEKRTAQLQKRTAQLLEQGAQLRESESFRRQVFESSTIPMVVIDPGSTALVDCNPAAIRLCGFDAREDVVGRALSSLATPRQPDGRASDEAARAHFAAARLEGTVSFEWRFLRPAGEAWDAEVGLSSFTAQGRPLLQATLLDVSVRRRIEKEKNQLQQQLIQAQKLEAVGTLAGGVAHDFNNILTGIMGNIELSRMSLAADNPAVPTLEEAMTASRRARDLVARILTFSRKTEATTEPTRLAPVTREALRLLRSTIPASVDFAEQVDDACPPVLCNATQIHQIVLNLATNAAYAMRTRGGVLTVRLEQVTLTDGQLARHPQLEPGHRVRMVIADTGEGMPPEILARLFEPFFTTKPKGEGTGLGLSVVHGIVTSCGGAIVVTSQPGEGSVFELYFPVAAGVAPAHDGHRWAETDHRGRGQSILIVDDDRQVIAVLASILRKLGYTPVSFGNPLAALDAFTANPGLYCAVLTDLTMPGLSGLDLARAIHAARPDLHVVIATGYLHDVNIGRNSSVGPLHFVQKPYSVAEISALLHNLLS